MIRYILLSDDALGQATLDDEEDERTSHDSVESMEEDDTSETEG